MPAAITSVLFCIFAVLFASCLAQQKSCYAKNDNPYLLFGKMTSYDVVNGKSEPEDIPDCDPVQLWMVSRHGTRYPHVGDKLFNHLPELRDQILRNHRERQDGFLCEEDLENLSRWSIDKSLNQDDDLTDQGRNEMKLLAQRYKSRFPTLLALPYDAAAFSFRYTNTSRARESADAFAQGLFGGEEGSSIPLPAPMRYDPVLEAYNYCTAWLTMVLYDPVEEELFDSGPLVLKMEHDVSRRLGFQYQLTHTQISNIYEMCRYDKAWRVNQLSPWCAAFTRDELKLFEYSEDLKYYYQKGYGNEMNIKLGCPTVQDLIQRFSKLETDNNEQPSGVFYFGHSTVILNTLSALGIARDNIKPDHSNYEVMRSRRWRITKIGPFASNLAAVFFKCSKGDPHRIMFFLEEAVVPYEGCDEGLCSWAFIKDKFSNRTRECNLDWCSDSVNSLASLEMIWLVPLASILLLIISVFESYKLRGKSIVRVKRCIRRMSRRPLLLDLHQGQVL